MRPCGWAVCLRWTTVRMASRTDGRESQTDLRIGDARDGRPSGGGAAGSSERESEPRATLNSTLLIAVSVSGIQAISDPLTRPRRAAPPAGLGTRRFRSAHEVSRRRTGGFFISEVDRIWALAFGPKNGRWCSTSTDSSGLIWRDSSRPTQSARSAAPITWARPICFFFPFLIHVHPRYT